MDLRWGTSVQPAGAGRRHQGLRPHRQRNYGIVKRCCLIEIKIPKEVRDYHENIFFGLNTRQFICSVLAVGVAVGIYFALQPYVGTEEIGWMCILGAAPFAACGFFTYHGMTAEQVLWAWFKSEILCPKRLVFKSDSYYYEAMQPAIRAGIKRKRGLPMKKNTHDSEETA